jgi:hypothetical protein
MGGLGIFLKDEYLARGEGGGWKGQRPLSLCWLS